MVRGSRTPHKTQPMMVARLNENGRMWGQQERLPTVSLSPWSWYFGSKIWDLDLAIWEGLLLTDSAGQMFVRSFSIEGETRGRQKRGLDVPSSWYVASASRFQKIVAF